MWEIGVLYSVVVCIAIMLKLKVKNSPQIVDKEVVESMCLVWLKTIVTGLTFLFIALEFHKGLMYNVLTGKELLSKMMIGIIWVIITYLYNQLLQYILKQDKTKKTILSEHIYHIMTLIHMLTMFYLAIVIGCISFLKQWGIVGVIATSIFLIIVSSKVLGKLTGLWIKKESGIHTINVINNWITLGLDSCCLGIILYLTIMR